MLYLGINQHARQLTISLRDDSGDVMQSPKGEKTQPTMKTLRHLRLDQIIDVISAQDSRHDGDKEMLGLQDRICHR